MPVVYVYMVFYNATLEMYQPCINVFIVKSYGKNYLKNIYIFSINYIKINNNFDYTLMKAELRT